MTLTDNVAWAPTSPFRSEERGDVSDEEEWTEAPSASYLDSPFRGAARDTGRGSVDAHSEAVRELLAELYSDEMEEALSELLEETAALHAEHSAALVGATASEAAEQPVREHLEALAEQAERYLEALAEAAGEADTRSLTEAELESVFESVAPPAGVGESPAFEQFLGALKNFAKKAVSGAVNLAKKGVQAVKTGVKAVAKVMPIGVILRQLRPIVQPLLMRVLKIAIGRLPAPVRPIATQLARKLLREAPMTEAEETEEAASADRAPAAEALGAEPAPAALLSLELAGATAGLLLTGDESEREAWAAEAAQSLSGGAAEAYGQQSPAAEAEALAEARERFTEALGRLPDGGDPRPALEEFLPVVMAALPIVRKIVQIAGRQNVVGALSNLLAALIGKFTGPRNARILADAVADTGLKLLSMETAAEAPERLAASALAATAEDTVRQLAQLPAEELEDPVRLEVAAGKAFNVAAAANIPSTLLREDLAETEAPGVKGMWVPLPRGAKGALRYKKYSRVFEVEVGAEQAAALRTGGGTPLATVLRDQFRVRAFPVRLKIHLYEAGAHSWARQIQAAEQRGAGRAGARLLTLLPLTRQAADSLLGHPGLGMAKVPKVVKGRQLPRGVRLYGIELADRRQGAGGGAAAPGHQRRPTEVQLTVDARAGRESLAIALHLAEERAQDILRSAGTPPAVGPFLGSLGSALAEATVTALFGGESRNVRVFREAYEQSSHLSPADEGEEFVSSLPPRLRDAVAEGLKRAAGQAFAQYFKGRVDEFARALQDPRDGVTLVVTLPGAPLVGIVTGILARRLPSLPEVSRAVAALAAEPAAKVEVKAGRHRG